MRSKLGAALSVIVVTDTEWLVFCWLAFVVSLPCPVTATIVHSRAYEFEVRPSAMAPCSDEACLV